MLDLINTIRQGRFITQATLVCIAVMLVMTVGEYQSRAHTRWCNALASSSNHFVLAGTRRTPCFAHRALVLGAAILYQARGVLALPVPSEDKATDIAMKSYELAQISYKTMVAMGAFMTALALVNSAIVIAQFFSRRRYERSGNPVNCGISAAAHEALGQPVSDGDPAPDSGLELLSLGSEAIAFADDKGSDSEEPERSFKQALPMPAERPSRSPSAGS
ncbi:hypothetical protein F4680DRAFT_449860 [Xylaria scruposa]|nr:hypothetical protein F4680DRAFT_449860 [Xylaria scruposa]